MPTFVVDVFGTYVAQLIVNDGTVDSLPDTVTISTLNSAPIADTGADQSIYVGDTVMLDGSGSSDVDGDPLIYSWSLASRPAGSSVVLSDPAAVMPTFVVDVFGTYVAQLIVNDGTVDSPPDTVTISTLNSIPVADAGADQSLYVGDTVTLDGIGSSDADGDLLTYSWSIASRPAGSSVVLSDAAAVMPTFVSDVLGAYVAQLIVNDGTVDSAPDTVTISAVNRAPVADAGEDQAVVVIGTLIELDGSQSWDPDGDSLVYNWVLTQQPTASTATIDNPAAVNPSFVADVQGDYIVSLAVADDYGAISVDSMIVSFQNLPPVADPGGNQSAVVGDTVVLSGSGSSDANGDPLTYLWSLSSPMGSLAELVDATAVETSFIADLPGEYTLTLIVNDGFVNSPPAEITVLVTTSQAAASVVLMDTVEAVNEIVEQSPGSLKNTNLGNALTNKINSALELIDQGLYAEALAKLENDILSKTDGCAEGGAPDKTTG